MKYIGIAIWSVLLAFLSLSCVKEQGRSKCPTEYSVVLGIKDKNYSNIGSIAGLQPKDEQLAFGQYVSNLSYQLIDPGTGKVIQEVGNVDVAGNDLVQKIVFPGIEAGHYVLNLFGNIGLQPEWRDGQLVYQLHFNNQEGEDIYVLNDNIYFSSALEEKQLFLQRTKGLLFIQLENIPDTVGRVVVEVDHVYREVNQNLAYNDETSISKAFTGNLRPSVDLQTFLAPTVTGKESALRLSFYKQDATEPFMYLPDIRMTVNRNEVTAFKINYKPEGGIEVWVSVDGAWMKQHDMDFE